MKREGKVVSGGKQGTSDCKVAPQSTEAFACRETSNCRTHLPPQSRW